MIWILSTHRDPTTEAVCDWIDAQGNEWRRLNGEDLGNKTGFRVRIASGSAASSTALHRGSHENRALNQHVCPRQSERSETNMSGATVVWLRRWHHSKYDDATALFPDVDGHRAVRTFLRREMTRVRDLALQKAHQAHWPVTTAQSEPNKINVLATAASAGLEVPTTLITTDREALLAFVDEVGAVITKPIGENQGFRHGGELYSMYTATLDRDAASKSPRWFFPSLFQEAIQRRYELRVFYLNGISRAMAIHPASRPPTTDVRQYNADRPQRRIPFSLPRPIAQAIDRLMCALQLEMGSLDFLRAQDGRYVFLEVNPGGQFASTSRMCNYRLERAVAESLVASSVKQASRPRSKSDASESTLSLTATES